MVAVATTEDLMTSVRHIADKFAEHINRSHDLRCMPSCIVSGLVPDNGMETKFEDDSGNPLIELAVRALSGDCGSTFIRFNYYGTLLQVRVLGLQDCGDEYTYDDIDTVSPGGFRPLLEELEVAVRARLKIGHFQEST